MRQIDRSPAETATRLRADLHVHSYHSGRAAHLRFLNTRDCYSDPDDVYRVAKARGMDLVCLTDHDSIDGCLEFQARHPECTDFIAGEEIGCVLPPRARGDRTSPPVVIHIGVLGMTEAIHRDVQPLRGNVFELVEYLRRRDVFFALNHLFFFFRSQLPAVEYVDALLAAFPALEARNGAMSREHNELIEAIGRAPESAAQPARVLVGGSDAHTLAYVGRTWTEAPARNREEFLAALKAGRCSVGGAHGSALRMAREIYSVVGTYYAGLAGAARNELTWRDRLIGWPFSLAALPFQFIPAIVTVAHKRRERATIQRVRAEWTAASLAAGAGVSPREVEALT
jgi:predicted metal-dependent phosphoesterase TrpH